MARILIAREFGANPGNLAQLLPVAARLRAKNHQVVFAVGDVTRAEDVVGRYRFEYLQAPVWHERRTRPFAPACSYAEILQQNGYADREGLLGMLKAWREIYRLVDPQAVLFHHAPTALLASRGFEWARVLCGVGFCSPPRVSPFPNFRTWEEVSPERLERSDAQVLDTMNFALDKLRLRPLGAAHELFNVDHEFLCSFPELDHYGSRPAAPYCGPVFAPDDGAEPVWPEHGEKRIYVCLSPEARAFATVGELLRDSAHSVLWVAPGITEKAARRYQDDRLRFVQEPVRLAGVAAAADAAVLSGGHDSVSAMLLAGVPMALFPVHVEHALLSHNVVQLGAAAMAAPQAPGDEIRHSLAAVLEEARFRESAKRFAIRYTQHDPQKTAARIARRIGSYCETAKL